MIRLILLVLIFAFVGKVKAQTDTVPPQFQMLGAPCIKICKGSTYTDSGFTYYDLPDSFADVTIVQEGSFITNGTANTGYYKMRLKGYDKSGNIGYSEWRKIQVVDSSELPNCQPVAVDCDAMDTISPVIELIGDPVVSVCQCCAYEDLGYNVSDNIDSIKYITVQQEGSIVTGEIKHEGVYNMRYKVTDRAGNASYSEWRIIFVRNGYEFPCDYYSACCVSVEEELLSNLFNIYPNPANEELFIGTDQMVIAISIYSISGQKISETGINQTLNLPYKIDTKHFPAGVYMVQLKTSSGILYKKVQISR